MGGEIKALLPIVAVGAARARRFLEVKKPTHRKERGRARGEEREGICLREGGGEVCWCHFSAVRGPREEVNKRRIGSIAGPEKRIERGEKETLHGGKGSI